ncbi:MAG TPA: DUF3147 family protein [Polyangiaceae bacterium]|jgi:hypothetical protein|nr:DUF3147 family protein [Polyangiaceae bacterium]
MIPEVSFEGLKRPKAWEHALRFAFGGTVAVGAALIGKAFGPSAGGLFLAFPAILPATITLVKKHDGRAQAVDDARGARLGALALICFAVVTLTLHRHGATLSLLAAVLAWFAAAFLLWFWVYGREPQ